MLSGLPVFTQHNVPRHIRLVPGRIRTIYHEMIITFGLHWQVSRFRDDGYEYSFFIRYIPRIVISERESFLPLPPSYGYGRRSYYVSLPYKSPASHRPPDPYRNEYMARLQGSTLSAGAFSVMTGFMVSPCFSSSEQDTSKTEDSRTITMDK